MVLENFSGNILHLGLPPKVIGFYSYASQIVSLVLMASERLLEFEMKVFFFFKFSFGNKITLVDEKLL